MCEVMHSVAESTYLLHQAVTLALLIGTRHAEALPCREPQTVISVVSDVPHVTCRAPEAGPAQGGCAWGMRGCWSALKS